MGTKTENGRVLKFILFPLLVISLIGVFIYPPLRTAFALYLILGFWALNAYMNKHYSDEVHGIKKGFLKHYGFGILIGVVFLVLSAIAPTFSLLTPSISFSVSEDLRFFVVIILAGTLEETFRSATISYIKNIYKIKKFWKINIYQSLVFMLLHTLVYGIAMNVYQNWFQLYSAFWVVSSSMAAAFLFGLTSGYLMEKFESIVPSIAAHQVINWWLIKQGMIVVMMILSLIIS